MSNAMVNLITRETTKKQMEAAYKNYPQTTPHGKFEKFHASTVEPIVCEVPDGCSVLDVGANDGSMMELLKKKGCRVVGVDISEVAIKAAKAKGLRVLNASAEDLPFKDKRFDVVILREVLIHIHEPLKALKEIRRVLKPNGFLLGLVPHANLERIVWDDARLHHRYYNEVTLKEDLSKDFDVTHLRILNGAQFAMAFANSLMGDKPAEMLFKSGGQGTMGWEDALIKDKKTLRVWFGPTQPPGDVYYRMTGYAEKMRTIKGVEIGYEAFSYKSNDGCNEWQRKILDDGSGNPVSSLAVHHFEKCLKVANPWVFQVTYYEDVLGILQCAKEGYPDKKIITECDDWLFDLPAYNIASNPYKPGSEKEKIAYGQLEISDAVIVSTEFIKDGLHKMFPDKKIYVIPNSIDFNVWDKVKSDEQTEKKAEGVIRIAYSGCANHGGDMEIVKPVLLALLDEFPNVEFLTAQDAGTFKDVNHPRLKILNRWVDIISYPSMLKGMDADIGIAPLRDNSFNRSKSNLRWLEFSALRIPTVASRVRPFEESIAHGKDGLLCSSKQDFYDSLKMLIESPALRSEMGREAYNQVKARFSMDDWAVKYANILKKVRG